MRFGLAPGHANLNGAGPNEQQRREGGRPREPGREELPARHATSTPVTIIHSLSEDLMRQTKLVDAKAATSEPNNKEGNAERCR